MSDLPTQPNMNIQQMLFDECTGIDISGAKDIVAKCKRYSRIAESEIREESIRLHKMLNQWSMELAEQAISKGYHPNGLNGDWEDRGSALGGCVDFLLRKFEEEVVNKYAPYIYISREREVCPSSLGLIYGYNPKLVKFKPSEITFPTYIGDKRVYGLLVPHILKEILPKFQGDVANMYIYSTKGDNNINIQIKFGDYPTIMGTYYLGQLIGGAYAINIDANIGNVSPVYDPSAEF